MNVNLLPALPSNHVDTLSLHIRRNDKIILTQDPRHRDVLVPSIGQLPSKAEVGLMTHRFDDFNGLFEVEVRESGLSDGLDVDETQKTVLGRIDQPSVPRCQRVMVSFTSPTSTISFGGSSISFVELGPASGTCALR